MRNHRTALPDGVFTLLTLAVTENGRNFPDSCIGHSAGRILAVAVEKI